MQWDSRKTLVWRGHDYHAWHVTDDTPMGEGYITVKDEGGRWCVLAPTVRDRVELAGVPAPWDGATPQAWRDEHSQEVADHGGWVVWAYGPGDFVGGPRYADELDALAAQTVATLVLEG